MLRRLPAVLSVIVVLSGTTRSTATLAAGVSRPDPAAVAIALTRDKLAIAPVQIGASGEHRFLIDTGSTSTIVSERLAASLGLMPYATTTTLTVTGSYRATVVTLPPLTIAGETFAGTTASVAPLTALRDVDPLLEGILGQDVLGRVNWLLDYRRKLLTLDSADRLSGDVTGSRIAARLIEARPVVETAAAGAGVLRLVLDSAATHVLLFGNNSPTMVTQSALLATNARTASVTTARWPHLLLGRLRFTDVPVVLIPAPATAGENGLLPTSLFSAVYFDNHHAEVVLNARLPHAP